MPNGKSLRSHLWIDTGLLKASSSSSLVLDHKRFYNEPGGLRKERSHRAYHYRESTRYSDLNGYNTCVWTPNRERGYEQDNYQRAPTAFGPGEPTNEHNQKTYYHKETDRSDNINGGNTSAWTPNCERRYLGSSVTNPEQYNFFRGGMTRTSYAHRKTFPKPDNNCFVKQMQRMDNIIQNIKVHTQKHRKNAGPVPKNSYKQDKCKYKHDVNYSLKGKSSVLSDPKNNQI